MFDRYTPEARRVFGFARREAEAMRHASIRTPHLLLGLVAEWADVSQTVLRELEVDLFRVRPAVESLVVAGVAAPTHEPLHFSHRAATVLRLAEFEADALGDTHLGTEHLLLGLLHTEDPIVAQVLAEVAPPLRAVRRRVARIRTLD